MQDKLFILPSREPPEPGRTSTHNLPAQLTPLIGREQEVAEAYTLLRRQDVRLVTLTGTGGVGKTRLALQVATELQDDFPNGVSFVSLAPISDPDLVISTMAQVLDLKESGARPLLDLLKAFLRDKRLLLLLDNFEQIIAAAPVLADLLEACPQLKMLVTSREVLRVRGEHEFVVQPLLVPDLKQSTESEALSHYASVTLFTQRAQAVNPDFQVTDSNAHTIAAICARLDGLPLALELAAARLKLLSPQALLARLAHRLQVLTRGARDVSERQQTLRNTIQWSYDLLSVEEQCLFRCLSVFVGGCTLESAEAVCKARDDVSLDVLNGVASLVDKNLVQRREQSGGESRLLMLETIREFGLEVLTMSRELEVTQHAHALYYLQLAEEAEPHLRGAEQQRWSDRLEREHDNLRAALNCLLERGEARESIEMALRLGGALYYFGLSRISEGWTLLERALARSEGVAGSVRAKALWAAGNLAGWLGDSDRAEALCQESLALFREVGDTAGVGNALLHLGITRWLRDDLETARPRLEESLATLKEAGDKWGMAWSLHFLSVVDIKRGEYTRGRSRAEAGLVLFRELGEKNGIATSLHVLAGGYLDEGDAAKAHPLLEESLTLYKEMGNRDFEGFVLGDLGRAAFFHGNMALARSLLEEGLRNFQEEYDEEYGKNSQDNKAWTLSYLAKVVASQGDYATARALYEQCLAIDRKLHFKQNTPFYLEGLAGVIAAQGELPWAARLWGAAETLREALGTLLPPVYRADYEHSIAAVRAQLGRKAFAAAWAEGRAMTPDQALAAQGPETVPMPVPTEQPSPSPAKSAVIYPNDLTAREVEVLRLLARGLTDAQIAGQLVISKYTASNHVKSILSKLGVTTRSAATRYAIEHQLV